MNKKNNPKKNRTDNVNISPEQMAFLYDRALQQARLRSIFLLSLLIIIVVILVGRAFWLQVVADEKYISEGEKRYLRVEQIRGKRGIITDRNGEVLAMSESFAKIIASPNIYRSVIAKYRPEQLQKNHEKIEALAKYINKPIALVNNQLSTNGNYIVLADNKQPQLASIYTKDIPGLDIKIYNKRLYPTAEVNASLLGITDFHDNGQEGLERYFNLRLKDKVGLVRKTQDLRKQVITADIINQPQDGENIALSLDNRLQQYGYSILKEYVTTSEAIDAALVMIDTISGEILVMVSYPSFNPNNRQKLKYHNLRNIAISDIFEPGSTIKPFFAALLLEKKLASADEIYNTGKKLIVAGKPIVDAVYRKQLTLSEVISYSSNRGIVLATEDLTQEDSYEMLSKLGFGKVLPISLPGSVTGVLRDYRNWHKLDKATITFGHTISTSLLQLLRAYTVFARGGEIIQPTILKTENLRAKGRRVFSTSSINKINLMLEQTISNGTGRLAQITDYTVAGKTGTVKKLLGGEYQKKYRATFVGFAPARNPQLLLAVMVNEPNANSQYYSGGGVAAPIFSKVMARALQLRGIKPDLYKQYQTVQAVDEQ